LRQKLKDEGALDAQNYNQDVILIWLDLKNIKK
jgi:hypothetical protein